MITKQVINTLYKKYRKLPESPDCLDMPLLFDYIVPFENWVAIMLHSSIIFLDRRSPKVSVHIRQHRPSFIERVRGLLGW